MSYDEIFKLVQDGNYYNVAVESMSKPKLFGQRRAFGA